MQKKIGRRERVRFAELPDRLHLPVFQSHRHPQSVAGTTSIMEPSVMKPTNVTECSRPVHQQPRNRGQTDHGITQINHGKVTGNFMAGDIPKTCGTHQNTTIDGGYLDTEESFTGDRCTRWRPLVNNMAHTTFTQSSLSVSSAVCESFFFRCTGKLETKSQFTAPQWLRGN